MPQSSPETNTQSSNTWQPPDPGFLAAELINHSDIGSSDLVDFDASLDENSSPDNPFINFAAEEASESEPEEPVFKNSVIKFNSAEKRTQICTSLDFAWS